jgi:hypothetical protein
MNWMPRESGAIVVVASCWLAACGGFPPSPTAPTPPTPVQYAFTQISGNVSDTAFRPVAGVRVEIVDGSEAGASVASDASGRFSFSGGTFVDATKFRASKDGYVSGQNNCYTTPAGQKLAYAQCRSANDQMILTRR